MSGASADPTLPFAIDAHGNFNLNVLEFSLPDSEDTSGEDIFDCSGDRIALVKTCDLPIRALESTALVRRTHIDVRQRALSLPSNRT